MAMREVAVRRAGILVALMASGVASRAVAQERVQPQEKSKPHRFFRAPIDFWGKGLTLRRIRTATSDEVEPKIKRVPGPDTSPADDWGSVVRLPNGQKSFQSLPAPLVAVLEDPSPEKVEAYFTWRLRRTAKIMRAAEAIKAYRKDLLGTGQGDVPSIIAKPSVPQPVPSSSSTKAGYGSQGVRLIYFHKKGCPHCDTQDVVLTEWLGKYPKVKLEVVEFGEQPELWRKHRVRGTPSIYIKNAGSGRSRFLEGLASKAELDRSLAQCQGKTPEGSTEKGGNR